MLTMKLHAAVAVCALLLLSAARAQPGLPEGTSFDVNADGSYSVSLWCYEAEK